MHIEVSTDNNIKGSEAITAQIKGWVQHDLAHHAEQLTGIEVHLSDANADKSGPDDIKCVLEARIKGQQPLAVTESSSTLEQATRGAASKMNNALQSALGKRMDRR